MAVNEGILAGRRPAQSGVLFMQQRADRWPRLPASNLNARCNLINEGDSEEDRNATQHGNGTVTHRKAAGNQSVLIGLSIQQH